MFAPAFFFGRTVGVAGMVCAVVYETTKALTTLFVVCHLAKTWRVSRNDVAEGLFNGIMTEGYWSWDAPTFKEKLLRNRFERRFKENLDRTSRIKLRED